MPASFTLASCRGLVCSKVGKASKASTTPCYSPLEGQEDRGDARLVCCVDHVSALSFWHGIQQHTHHLSACCTRCHVDGSPAIGTWRRTCSVLHMQCAPPTELVGELTVLASAWGCADNRVPVCCWPPDKSHSRCPVCSVPHKLQHTCPCTPLSSGQCQSPAACAPSPHGWTQLPSAGRCAPSDPAGTACDSVSTHTHQVDALCTACQAAMRRSPRPADRSACQPGTKQ